MFLGAGEGGGREAWSGGRFSGGEGLGGGLVGGRDWGEV